MSHVVSGGTAQSPQGKYFHFGFRLWKVRKGRGYSSEQVAECLETSVEEYKKYENGTALPEKAHLVILAKVLGIEMGQLMQRSAFSRHKVREELPQQGALKYSADWDAAAKAFKIKTNANQNFSQLLSDVLVGLKKDVSRIMTLPSLPMSLFLIFDAVFETKKKHVYLHEYADFMTEGESLAGFVARDPYLAGYVFYAANKLYFPKNPSQNIPDCLNRMTMQQFTDLLFFAVINNGVYTDYEDLSALQQFNEFASLGAVMVRELSPFLPPAVSADHLYMATLLQSIGTYAFYTLLRPSLMTEKKENDAYSALTDAHLEMINYELHPVVSGMIAANWGFADDVVKALIEHHQQPTHTVSPLCAALKLVNYFVDMDFPALGMEEIKKIMAGYPQLPVSHDALMRVAATMSKLSVNMAEMSSTVIQDKVRDAAELYSKRIKSFKANNSVFGEQGEVLFVRRPPSKSELRFQPEYGKILSIECQLMLNRFYNLKVNPLREETIEAYGTRMQDLQLQRHYLSTGDITAVAQKFSMSPDTLKLRLKLV